MEGNSASTRPRSLGGRLEVVAVVGALAALVVLLMSLVAALAADLPTGAVASPAHQRIVLATQPAGIELSLIALVAATALSASRWLHAEHAVGGDRVGPLVAWTGALVAATAAVGFVAEVVWRYDTAYWRLQAVGTHAAAAALGVLAWWLADVAGRSGAPAA